jgi:hypothetical protein
MSRAGALQGGRLARARHWCAPAPHALLRRALPGAAGGGAVRLAARLRTAALAFLLDHQVRAPSLTPTLLDHEVHAAPS